MALWRRHPVSKQDGAASESSSSRAGIVRIFLRRFCFSKVVSNNISWWVENFLQQIFSSKSDCRIANVCPSVTGTPLPLRVLPIAIMPIGWPSCVSAISLLALVPIIDLICFCNFFSDKMVWELFERYSIRPPTWGQRPKLTSEVTWLLCQNDIKSRGHPKHLKVYPRPKIQKKSFKKMPEVRKSDNGKIMKEGWNSNLWSEIVGSYLRMVLELFQPSFIISPLSLFLTFALLLKVFFWIFDLG